MSRRHTRSFASMSVLLLALGFSDVAFAEITCEIAEKFSCSKAGGCEVVKNTVFIRIRPDDRAYLRCDAKGCDTYTALFSLSGEFVNVAVPEHGLLAKFSGDGSSFTEVATLGTDVLLSFGRCRE